jgi:RimJ/RimL family protein N-acetyltransferase
MTAVPRSGRERVSLRQWRDSDLGGYAEMNADAEVMRHFPRALTRAESKMYMDRCRALVDERGWGLWAVDVDGVFAGFTGLSRPRFTSHFTPCVEIGWRLRRQYWGRGIAHKAALAAESHAFLVLRLAELVSFTAVENLRSRRLMERLDFHRKEGEDFMHPLLPLDSPLLWHVLYWKENPFQKW